MLLCENMDDEDEDEDEREDQDDDGVVFWRNTTCLLIKYQHRHLCPGPTLCK
ncbi:hypothetical protein EC973_000340 [Apophysomyces ossiformis]|uniref:Uncharacterized protein n=1 Tax=Apophysomyces ossiformis TaxID=679940 RepID=A0A8H7BRW0_9FUNG|nr:hypothetical protein EC973_000340 [Apophysomyces ossiformis]